MLIIEEQEIYFSEKLKKYKCMCYAFIKFLASTKKSVRASNTEYTEN